MVLGHLSLGVRDLERTRRFYDAAMAPLGWTRVWTHEKGIGYGPPGGNDKLALFPKPDSDGPLAAGPGFHLALNAPNRQAVTDAHAAAIHSGGTCEGAPGLREHYSPTYFAAFVRDPDGHKLEFVHQ